LQQRLDKATRDLNSERQRCEAAVSNSAQLQQRLDAALSMSCSASALSSAFESLLPPSPPRFNIELSQSPTAAAASPAPSLHAQLSQVSVSATDARAMAAAAAATSAAASVTEAATLQRVHCRTAAASDSCSRIATGLSHVLQRMQGMQARLREQQLQLKESQVRAPQMQPIRSLSHTPSSPQRCAAGLKAAAGCSLLLFLLLSSYVAALLFVDFDSLPPNPGFTLPQ
jgi:hypothetical protein